MATKKKKSAAKKSPAKKVAKAAAAKATKKIAKKATKKAAKKAVKKTAQKAAKKSTVKKSATKKTAAKKVTKKAATKTPAKKSAKKSAKKAATKTPAKKSAKKAAKKAATKTPAKKSAVKKPAKKAAAKVAGGNKAANTNATATVVQHVHLPASTAEVYALLTDPEAHGRVTGSVCTGTPVEGGAWTAGSGYMSGVYESLSANHRIVTSWRTTEWPKGAPDSHLEFLLEEDDGACELVMTHAGLPPSQAEAYRQGWIDFYWTPIRATLGDGEH